MPEGMAIGHVRFVAAEPEEADRGLLGWVSFTLDRRLRVDGVAIRKTLSGDLRLSFPSRRDGSGRRHFILRPLSDAARREIEVQVFRALGVEEVSR